MLSPGDTVSVTWGGERFSVVAYNSFEVGPFSVEVVVREDETPDEVYTRARQLLSDMARREYDAKLEGHLDRIKHAAEVAGVRSRR